MSPFEQLCRDTIVIRHQDGRASGPLKSAFSSDTFRIFDATLDVSEGDLVDRPLPNGKAERYDIIHVQFSQGLHAIPASYALRVRKQGSLVQYKEPNVTNINISNSHGFQVGDHNTQNIVDSFKQVIERIDQGPGTPDQKAEAKTRLRAFLEHSLTSAVMGGAVGGLLGLLK
jgi:hypothetical protein